MKSEVGSLALLDRNFPDGEERVFEMHLRLHLFLYVGSFLLFFNNDTPLLLQNKIRLVSPLQEIEKICSKNKKIKQIGSLEHVEKSLGSNGSHDYFGKVLVSTLAPMFLF